MIHAFFTGNVSLPPEKRFYTHNTPPTTRRRGIFWLLLMAVGTVLGAQTPVEATGGVVMRPGPPALLTYTLVDAFCQTNTDAVNMGETPWPFE